MKTQSTILDQKTKNHLVLQPYTGEWTRHQAAHLLRRTLYGPDRAEIDQSVEWGLQATIDELVRDINMPEPPLNFNDELDPFVPIGDTWVNAGRNNNSNNKRRRSLRAWTIGRALSKEFHIREKMTLFWHNHLVVSGPGNANAEYMYISLLREQSLGNFKQLIKDITIDPSMLEYLNGDENKKGSPNENYARELLELFTIGKGPIAGPGDYTNYTEEDIAVMAKILTGWKSTGFGNILKNDIHPIFRNGQHELGSKQLSHRFNNAIIENNGIDEYKDLIDVIFDQDEVARFMCRNLYQWFVHYNITADIESEVIQPLADIMIMSNYEIKPVIKALLSSAHFYEEQTIGCMIKNPMDFVIAGINAFGIELSSELKKAYRGWNSIFNFVSANQLTWYIHPSVAGWKAYYQSPGYYHTWLTSATLPLRQQYTDLLAIGNITQGEYFGVDVLKYIALLDNPNDINEVIIGFEEILFAKRLSDDQRLVMKNIVLQDLPDFEWTVEYNNYINNPDDENIKTSVENKVKLLLLSMMRLPEYQMS